MLCVSLGDGVHGRGHHVESCTTSNHLRFIPREAATAHCRSASWLGSRSSCLAISLADDDHSGGLGHQGMSDNNHDQPCDLSFAKLS